MQRVADGMWISVDCTQQKPFICEYLQVQQQTCTCPTALPCASTQPATQPSQNPCPNNDWVYSNNDDFSKCYYFNTSAINWNDSVVACQNLYSGATLVTIHSSAENDLITNVFRSKYPIPTASDSYYYWIWIGLRLIDPVNVVYQWVDNTALDYTNWDNTSPTGSTCVHFDPTLQDNGPYGQWVDAACDYTDQGFTSNLGFVCELQL
uniref:C-type lectin domain-containing protein n=1 Tax=Acrobeloides nanus TaxID=290746 RepID=A0A914E8X0_9BILA